MVEKSCVIGICFWNLKFVLCFLIELSLMGCYFLNIFRVGIGLPTIEVRYEHLNVEAEAFVGSRALPTLFNFIVNMFEVTMQQKFM